MIYDDFPYWPGGELGKALIRILSENSIKYRNRTILMDSENGYLYNDQWYASEEEAKAAIDESLVHIGVVNVAPSFQCEVSIVHKDGTETLLSEEQKEQYLVGKSPYCMYLETHK